MKLIKRTLLIIAFSITGNTFAKSHFIVDMIKLKANKSNLEIYINELKSIAKKYSGELNVNPINVIGQIETEVAPKYTSPFNYDYILIIHFDKKSNALNYTKDNRTLVNYNNITDLIIKQTVFFSKNMMALPGMPKFPEIENKLIRPEPSFILVNAIKMKSTLGAMMKMMKYFKRNHPTIAESGTHFFSTLKVVKVIKGDFDFNMLFLTEWASMDAFNELHNSIRFKENVHLRNSSFKRFTEGKGIINPL